MELLELLNKISYFFSEDSIFSVHGVKLWSEDQERRQHHLGAYSFRQLNHPSSTSASAALNPKTNYKRSATVQQFNWGDFFFSLLWIIKYYVLWMKIVVQLTNYDRSIIHQRRKKANNMPDVQSISSARIVLNGSLGI